MNIRPECLDVTEIPRGRFSGCLPRQGKIGEYASIFEENVPVIPRSEWQSVLEEHKPKLSPLSVYQYDQNGEGTCTSNAGNQSLCYTYAKQFGRKWVMPTSPIVAYKRCARGPNTGSSVSCIMRQLREVGTLPIDNPENRLKMAAAGLNPAHTLKAVGYYQKMPEGWRETAKHFRIEEYYDIRSVEGMFSALLLGFPIVYGRSGHAIMGADATKKDGQWYIRYHNSWGNWGDDGYGYDSERYLGRSSAAYGAVAVRSVIHTSAIEKLMESEE